MTVSNNKRNSKNITSFLICLSIVVYLIIFLYGDKIQHIYYNNNSVNGVNGVNIEKFGIYKESMLNSNTYKVQEYESPDKAADILAKLSKNTRIIIEHLKEHHYEDVRVVRLEKRLKELNIEEAVLEEGSSSYTINKGELMAFCLRHKTKDRKFHNIQTLMFVLIHELAHVMSVSEGHNAEFMVNFKFILKEAAKSGVYIPVDYSYNPMKYCGVKVTHNPYYS
jgi:hypothetical protein